MMCAMSNEVNLEEMYQDLWLFGLVLGSLLGVRALLRVRMQKPC